MATQKFPLENIPTLSEIAPISMGPVQVPENIRNMGFGDLTSSFKSFKLPKIDAMMIIIMAAAFFVLYKYHMKSKYLIKIDAEGNPKPNYIYITIIAIVIAFVLSYINTTMGITKRFGF